MIPALGFAGLLTVMMMGKLYPKETIIITAIVVLLILAYPIITHVDLAGIASPCACSTVRP